MEKGYQNVREREQHLLWWRKREEDEEKRERKGLDGQRAKSWLVWSNTPQDSSSIIATDRIVYRLCIPHNAVSRHFCLHLMPYWPCSAVSISSPVAAILRRPIQRSILHTEYYSVGEPMDESNASMILFCFQSRTLQSAYVYNSVYHVPVRVPCYGALWKDQDQARSLQRPPVQQCSPALSSVCPLHRIVLLLSCPVLLFMVSFQGKHRARGTTRPPANHSRHAGRSGCLLNPSGRSP